MKKSIGVLKDRLFKPLFLQGCTGERFSIFGFQFLRNDSNKFAFILGLLLIWGSFQFSMSCWVKRIEITTVDLI